MHYLTVGVLCIDEVYDLKEFPVEDSKVRAESKTATRGGSAGNAATVLRRIQRVSRSVSDQQRDSVSICAAIANDSEGRFIESDCAACEIDTKTLIWRDETKESTPKSIVLRVKETRTIIHHRNADEIQCDEFSPVLRGFMQSRQDDLWIHFEGRSTVETMKMITFVQSQTFGSRRTYSSLELERSRTGDEFKLLTASFDVVVFSHGFIKSFGFTEFQSFVDSFLIAQGYGPSGRALWVCTMGDKGSDVVVVTKDTCEERFHCPAKPVDTVVDSLGAGDAFLAGLIFAVGTLKKTHREAVEYATIVAADKIQRKGF